MITLAARNIRLIEACLNKDLCCHPERREGSPGWMWILRPWLRMTDEEFVNAEPNEQN